MDALERLAHRVLLPGFDGLEPPDWLVRRAAALGGVCLYARNVESPAQVKRLCDALHAANPSLLIAIDEEGGDVTRLEAATGSSYPGNLALGAAGDVALTGAVARSIGLELAAAGIDLDLAPVADVNSNPANPVIGVRSFGSDPSQVAAHVAAWVEGLQAAGVAACAKHFPGHGDTSVDSHLAVPVTDADPRDGALTPFAAAIDAGVRCVMSAHVIAPPIDSVPGTLSRAVMTGLLRGEMGFRGVAVSDGLEMAAVGDLEEGAVRALEAGCDLLCVGGGLRDEATVERLVHALAAGARPDRLAEAADRVYDLARWRAAQPLAVGAPDHDLGLRAARAAVRVDGDVGVGDEVTVAKLAAPPSIAVGQVPWGLEQALRDRGVRVHGDEAAGRRLAITVRDLHRHPDQAQAVAAILARRPDAIVVEMGLPACRPAEARNYVATMGAARVCGIAAAEVMTQRKGGRPPLRGTPRTGPLQRPDAGGGSAKPSPRGTGR